MDASALAAAFVALLRHPTGPGAIVIVALVVGGLVRTVRTETVSQWLDNTKPTWLKRLPKWSLPWIAQGLGLAVNVLNAKLNAHQDWGDAVAAGFAGILAGMLASGGQQSYGKILGAFIYKPLGPLTPPATAPGPEVPPAVAAAVASASMHPPAPAPASEPPPPPAAA